MVCPQCKAEYRRGFTVCRDCDVPLVESADLSGAIPPGGEAEAIPGDPSADPFCSFWKGMDLRVCTEVCAVLDEAGIPHRMIRRQDYLFNLNNQAPYQVGVPASLYERAELAIQDAFGTGEEEGNESRPAELVRNPAQIADSEPRGSRTDLKEWKQSQEPDSWLATDAHSEAPARPSGAGLRRDYPEDATALAWQGDAAEMREMIAMSLQENDIFARFEEKDGTAEVYVLPQDELRAKGIVREILEAQPPR